MRNILNVLAEDISENSSAYENQKVTKAEKAIIAYLLELVDHNDIPTLHTILISRYHELEKL